MNRPLQVYLHESDFARLEAWADARGWTKSQAVRAAIRALTSAADGEPLLDLSGDIDGLPPDLSERFTRYLDETYVAEPPSAYATRRRKRRRTAVRR